MRATNKYIKPFELKRKMLHLSSIWMPIMIYFLPRQQSLLILKASVGMLLILEITRRIFPTIRENRWLNSMLRPEEHKYFLCGATYFVLGIIVSLRCFGSEATIISTSILVFADTLAALVGLKYGQIHINNKTLEGTMTFFLTSIIIETILNRILHMQHNIEQVLLISFIATLIEFFSKNFRLNDNFTIPLGVAGVISLL